MNALSHFKDLLAFTKGTFGGSEMRQALGNCGNNYVVTAVTAVANGTRHGSLQPAFLAVPASTHSKNQYR